ncbi:MAG: hypothetical protein AAFN07_01830 [Pseudomonadota bacterium]
MTEQTQEQKTRVAIYLDRDSMPAWAQRLVEILHESAAVELVGVIRAPDRRSSRREPNQKTRWRHGRLRRGVRLRIQNLYRTLVDRNALFVDAWKPADASVLGRLPHVQCTDPLGQPQCQALIDMAFDVVVHCGLREVPERVVAMADHGVWSILGSPATLAQTYPAGFWPSLIGDTLTRSVLSVTFSNRAPIVLFESWMATSRLSTRDNVSRHYWKSLYAIPRALARLQQLGAAQFFAECQRRSDQSLPRNSVPGHPSAVRYALYVVGAMWRKVLQLLDTNLFEQRWRLRQSGKFSLGQQTELSAVFDNPQGCYRADPFLYETEGQYWLFFEEYADSRQLGHLSVVPIDEQGQFSGEARIILEQPYHLSYPQVFEWQGEHYMLPETSANQTVELYKAIDFPYHWELQAVLMEEIDASDATLLFQANKWWLFANVRTHVAISSQDECFLFYSDSILGPWRPHALNPVVSDCRTSRPAGAIFERNGRLIRPTQDSTFRYGYGLNFMEITELSEDAYSEVLLEHVPPDNATRAIGIHTYAELGQISYVDELFRRARWNKDRTR